MSHPHPPTRTKLLDAALAEIRTNGYSATTIDHLCARAGVTKGAFFHHFKSKEALGIAAATYWSDVTSPMFAQSAYHSLPDPRARIMAYLDLREALLAGEIAEFSCLAGTLLQEVHASSPTITAAAYAAITTHAETLEPDFAAAIAEHLPPDCPTAASLALHCQTVLQGAFILAKGTGNAAIAQDSLNHLRRYLTLLFPLPEEPKS